MKYRGRNERKSEREEADRGRSERVVGKRGTEIITVNLSGRIAESTKVRSRGGITCCRGRKPQGRDLAQPTNRGNRITEAVPPLLFKVLWEAHIR